MLCIAYDTKIEETTVRTRFGAQPKKDGLGPK